jgi:hypothetical protein
MAQHHRVTHTYPVRRSLGGVGLGQSALDLRQECISRRMAR